MSEDNNRLILQHLRNFKYLLDTFDETSQLLQQHLRRNNSQSNNTFPNINDIFNNVNQTPQNNRIITKKTKYQFKFSYLSK